MLTRFTDFVRGKLTHPNLDGEFNQQQSHANRILLQNPLNRDLDFNGFLARNFRATTAMEFRNAAEFSSIQDAVDDIGSGTPGTVFLPPNTVFDEDSTITVTTDVTIMGSGWSSVVRPSSSLTTGSLFDTSTNDRVQLLNFKIDGNDRTTSAVPAIDAAASGSTDFHMENVWVTGWGSSATSIATLRHGVDLRGNTNGKVVNCKFDNIEGSAIYCGGSAAGTGFSQLILANDIDLDGGGQHGIYVWTGFNVKVVHNIINRVDFSGIFIDGDSTTSRNTEVAWNQIHDTGNSAGTNYDTHGITAKIGGSTVHQLRIHHNQIYDVGRAGAASDAGRGIDIDLDAASSIVRGLSIKYNEIYSTQEDGIYFFITDNTSSVDNLVIDANEITDFSSQGTTYDGIHVERDTTGGNVRNIGIRGNTLGRTSAGNFNHGVRIVDGKATNDFTGIVNANQIFGTAGGRTISLADAESVVIGVNASSSDNPVFS